MAASVFVWILDAVFESIVFHEGPLLDLLILAIPTRELLHRLVLVAIILIVGGILTFMTAARDRAFQHTRHLNNALQAVRDLNQVIVQEHEIDEILKRTCNTLVGERDGYDDCWIAYFDQHGKFRDLYNARPTPQHERVRQHLSEGHLTRCLRTAQETDDVFMFENVSDTCGDCPLTDVYEHDCALVAPIKRGERMYGALCVTADRTFVDDAAEQALVLKAANDIALGLTAAASERHIRHLNAVLSAVRDVNQLIVREHDPDTLLQETCEILTTARRPYTTCWIALLQENEERVQVFHAGIDEHLGTFQRWLRENGSTSCMEILRRSGKPVVLIDTEADCGDCPLGQIRDEQSALVAPIQRGGHTYGYLGITIESEFGESAEEQGLVIEAANDLALGLHMAATEQQRDDAFENLRESEQRFRTALSKAPFPAMLHADDGEVVMINQVWTEITGYRHEEIPTIARWAEKAYPEDHQRMKGRIEGLYAGERRLDEGDFTVLTKSGEQRIWHFNSAPLGTLPDGRRLVLSMATDSTERRRAAQELRQHAQIIEQSHDMILVTDTEGYITFANEAEAEVLGFSREELIGSHISMLGDDPVHGATQEEILQAVVREGEWRGEVLNYTADGEEIILDSRIFALRNGYDDPTALVGISRDITDRKRLEQDLRARTDAIEAAADGVAVLGEDERYVYINRGHVQIYGYDSPDELIGHTWKMLYADDERERFEKEIMPEFQRKGHWRGEAVGLRRDGSTFPQEVSLTALDDGGLICVVRAISERKEAERALRESEAHYRAVFENTGTAMCIIEEDRTIALANEQFAELYGAPLEQIEGNIDFIDFIAPHEVERMTAYHEARRQSDVIPPTRYEFDFLRPDGEQRRILLTVDMIPGTERSVASLLDITEREQMERELRRSEALFRSVFEGIQDMFYRTDAEGRITLISPSISHYSDIPPGDFIGRTITDFWLYPEQRDEMLRMIRQKGEVQDFETTLENEHGECFVVSITSRARYDDSGEFTGVEGVFRDITERKEAEQERERYLNELQLINEVIVEASRMADVDEMCRLIAEAIRSVNEGTYVGVSLYDPTTSRVRIRSLVGAEDMIEKALSKLGRDLHSFTVTPERMARDAPWFTSGNLECVPNGIHGLMGGIFPAEVCKEIEEMANITDVYTVGFALDEQPYGGISIFVPEGGELQYKSAIETLATHMSALLQKRQAEKQLLQSEQRFRTAVFEAPFPIALHAEDGEITTVNKAWTQITGYAHEDMPTVDEWVKRAYRNTPPSERPNIEEVYEIRGRADRGEQTITTSSGEERIWHFTATRLGHLPDGRRLVMTMASDVTEDRQHEERIRELSQFQRAIIDQANIWIAAIDEEGRVTLWNEAAEAISGYSAEEVLGESEVWWWLHGNDEYFDKVVEDVEKLIYEDEAVENYTTHIETRDGDERIVSWNARTLRGPDGAAHGAILIGRDVTEHRQLEQQLIQSQKMEAIGQLAGGVAHDFNNMLTAIIGHAQLLQIFLDDDKDERVQSSLRQILQVAERSADRTQQLLGFSRKQQLRPEVLDINALLRDITPMLDRIIEEDMQLVTELHPDQLCIDADPLNIQQVILNLVVNARDAMPEGGTVRLTTESVAIGEETPFTAMDMEPGQYARIRVTDTGIGMDEQTQSRIFEPFFTTKDENQGTGLGLSTTYGVVQQSGGHIQVDSTPGRGTTFTIYLPQTDKQLPEPVEPSAETGDSTGTETILVAEDDDQVREFAVAMLKDRGYDVIACEDGQATLEAVEELDRPVDLLLTDVVMPGMDGVELARKLQTRFDDLPVLYMSGYSEQRIPSDTEYLQKPFDAVTVVRRVREILDRQ
ncbi:MAG: PAS domain S-box protein [Armatimonadota bacterium]